MGKQLDLYEVIKDCEDEENNKLNAKETIRIREEERCK